MNKTLKNILGWTWPLVTLLVLPLSNLYENHSVYYRSGDERVFKKVDSFLSYTTLTISDDRSMSLYRNGFSSRRFYDKNGDGLVDRISVCGNPLKRGFHVEYFEKRDENPLLFESADQELENQLQRFRSFIDKHPR
jgi:hypothetical protein